MHVSDRLDLNITYDRKVYIFNFFHNKEYPLSPKSKKKIEWFMKSFGKTQTQDKWNGRERINKKVWDDSVSWIQTKTFPSKKNQKEVQLKTYSEEVLRKKRIG